MSFTTLKFFVKENDSDFPICHMTEPETAAIGECVDDLVPSEWGQSFWYEADTCIMDYDEEGDDEDYVEPAYGLLRCFTHNPSPRNGSMFESRIPHPIPQAVLDRVAGKTFRVRPRQLGLNPWGDKVEITFESVSPPPPPPVPPTPNPEPTPAPAPAPPGPSHPGSPQPKAGVKVSDLIAAALKAH